ncbi:MAG: YcgL domain-containing protein [Pseudomonadales bacterium]|nr:YcgL domain-containing protein [Pseudomonadales bacterium]
MILCDVYKSQSKSEVYIYVDKVDGLSRVPESLLKEFEGPVICFSFKLTHDRKLSREDSRKVIENLKCQGYHLQMPPLVRGLLGKNHAT